MFKQSACFDDLVECDISTFVWLFWGNLVGPCHSIHEVASEERWLTGVFPAVRDLVIFGNQSWIDS